VERAAALVLILIACSGVGAQDLSKQGAEAMRAGRFGDAEQIYRQLVRQFPSDPGWHANLGLAFHSQGKYKEAAEELERSLKLQPSAGIAAVLGIDYLKLGDPCRAIAPLTMTDRLDALADANAACKRFREAAKLYEKLSKPRLAGHAYWKARDYADARRVFASIAVQYQEEPEFNYEYGDTLLRSEGAEAAIPVLERATSLIEGRAALGKAYVEAGRFKEAVPHLEAAIEADPDLLLPLSRAYKATGRAADADRALNDYRKRQAQK
jgi:tetratricopeptide (TPR) repeat protein